MHIESGQVGAGCGPPVDTPVVVDRQLGTHATSQVVATARAAKHQPVCSVADQPAGERLGDRPGQWHQADAGVALGPVLADPELPGVIADLHDLDPLLLQLDPGGAQAEQLAAAQPGANLHQEVIAIEGRAGMEEPGGPGSRENGRSRHWGS
jgi:hypothetical protein